MCYTVTIRQKGDFSHEILRGKRLRCSESESCQHHRSTGYFKTGLCTWSATGSSPVGTYKNLVAKYENGDLDFSQVKTANLDEYKGLPKDNDQSYYYSCMIICLIM